MNTCYLCLLYSYYVLVKEQIRPTSKKRIVFQKFMLCVFKLSFCAKFQEFFLGIINFLSLFSELFFLTFEVFSTYHQKGILLILSFFTFRQGFFEEMSGVFEVEFVSCFCSWHGGMYHYYVTFSFTISWLGFGIPTPIIITALVEDLVPFPLSLLRKFPFVITCCKKCITDLIRESFSKWLWCKLSVKIS